jgi:hypothetical protein
MNITIANLGWTLLVIEFAGQILAIAQGWFTDRYEVTRRGFRFTACRRWYGTHSQVTIHAEADADDPPRYVVLERDDENTAVPWLKVHRLDPEYLTYWDEDAEPFWAPVTVFAPFAVRRFRPGVTLTGRVPVPRLWQYPPMSGAHLGELLPLSRVAGDELELAPPCGGPLVAGEPFAEPVLEHGGEAGSSGVGDELNGVLGVAFAEDLEVERARSIGHVPQGTQRERG